MADIPEDIMTKARQSVIAEMSDFDRAKIGHSNVDRVIASVAAALLSERTAQEAEIARLTAAEAHVAKLEAVLNHVCDIAIGRDVLDGFPRGRDEIQRRLAKIYEITLAALTPAKENTDGA